eukprot:m.286712 g.286712  ORF g.286712 m.286712 type:complete len:63 (+) comp40696_c1_seq15:774-962(+)
MKSLCQQMITKEPSKRPTAQQCLKALKAVCDSVEYKRCAPKRMVKGKHHGGPRVVLIDMPWC